MKHSCFSFIVFLSTVCCVNLCALTTFAQTEALFDNMLPAGERVPLRQIIPSMTGYNVLDWDGEEGDAFSQVMENTFLKLRKEGVKAGRVNEAGLDVEQVLIEELKAAGFSADTPMAQSGKRRSVGYPDVEVRKGDQLFYLEVKTYNDDNVSSSQRTFYLSPSKDPKITGDGFHLLAAFSLKHEGDERYIATGYKLLDIASLECRLKYEFNASNRDLYTDDMVVFSSEELTSHE
ncbi:hypothetical protein [Rubellicoccus peritrichatus]|uniref:Restriction endonuclease n=1 Tax=Rubellicoccus peritrichatus TaxID=3080537 RepID=A0AAQ3QV81_9BACT|nr:hypothetical protein [Puniceicoccus sp. CR14]WOO41268.1 hypothetical protein RZN69_21825 [Puniceicoccus sp. CR14]